MALPEHIRALFNELPEARLAREQKERQAIADREAAAKAALEARDAERVALRADAQVTWDWLLSDGQELAAELRKANFQRLELIGPLDENGRPCEWHVGARALLLLEDGQLEVARQDDYRALRYVLHDAEELLRIEPPGVTRAFIDFIRSGAVWEQVARQLRASTAVRTPQ